MLLLNARKCQQSIPLALALACAAGSLAGLIRVLMAQNSHTWNGDSILAPGGRVTARPSLGVRTPAWRIPFLPAASLAEPARAAGPGLPPGGVNGHLCLAAALLASWQSRFHGHRAAPRRTLCGEKYPVSCSAVTAHTATAHTPTDYRLSVIFTVFFYLCQICFLGRWEWPNLR